MTSKSKLKQQFKEMLKKHYDAPVMEGDEDFFYFKNLISNHPTKNYENVTSFQVYEAGKGLGLMVNCENMSVPVGIDSCIGVKKNYLNECMRHTITPQIMDYRRTQILTCNNCKTTTGFMEIDHKFPFCEIRKDFLKNREPPKDFIHLEPWGRDFLPEDKDFKDEWISYHKKHATYQVLCRSCNAKKSNKIVKT